MKHLKPINEAFFTVHKKTMDEKIKNLCMDIAMEEVGISEKSFAALDRLELVLVQLIDEHNQEFNSIIQNCKSRNMRDRFCAEAIYHALLQGKFKALSERSWVMGGFKVNETN